MEKTRTLPPLVRGKVTGVLDFFVDKIRLSRNILLLTDNFDLVLQVQWWGEVIPACIRPKALQVEGRADKNSNFIETYYHSAKYEIKTTLDLFKSYLKCCEVVELSVLETFKNYVIGSAFLKDLIKLINSNNELIQMPIFDYLGEEIGEVIVHVNFLEKPPQENKNQSEGIQHNMSVKKKLEKQDYNTSKIKSCFNLGEKTIFYNGHSRKNEGEHYIESQVPVTKNKFRKNENMSTKSTLSVSQNNIDFLNINSKPICKDHKYFPQIKTFSDSSKVLYYSVNSQQFKQKSDIKNPKTKITNKFNSNTIKCKSKPAEKVSLTSHFSMNCKKNDVQNLEDPKNIIKKSTLFRNEEHIDCQPSLEVYKFMKSKPKLYYEPEGVRSEESSHVKVLNYLLGSEMSKDDEKTALNDFKKMSPSHNLVDSISELCLFSSNESTKSLNKFNISSASRKTYLNFDFDNPIERNYYETFFLKSNCASDFEIAEFLNKPENSIKLKKLKSNEIPSHKSESEISSLKSLNEFLFSDKKMIETESVECSANKINTGDRSSCARCKYYKKLKELDTIIESLKHFEEKIVSHEKKLQSTLDENLGMALSTNQLLKDTS